MRLALLLLAVALAVPAHAQPSYEGRAIVTGRDNRQREAGLRQGFREVMARVAGAPGLGTDARVDGMDFRPALVSFAYVDRMALLPRQDEQGSRDRPYDLFSQWSPRGVARALLLLRLEPWPAAARPVVAARVSVRPRVGEPFTVRADTDVDGDHRAALWEAGRRYGLVLQLDAETAIGPGPAVPGPAVPGPAAPGAEAGGDAAPADSPVLDGRLRWVEGEGWHADWALRAGARSWDWQSVPGSFDAAYRSGVANAVRALAEEWRSKK